METKKKHSKILENKKSLFFEIGLVITLVGVFYAFQWKVTERTVNDMDGLRQYETEEDMIHVPLPEPPKPKPPAPDLSELILKPDDDKSEDENLHVSIEVTENYRAEKFEPIVIPDEKLVDEPIIDIPDQMPEFPGGLQAMYRYLNQNLVYPRMERELGVTGTVFVGFVVERDGSITNVHIMRGPGAGLNGEALRVVEGMPRWNPGYVGARPVRVRYTLPIRFKLDSR